MAVGNSFYYIDVELRVCIEKKYELFCFYTVQGGHRIFVNVFCRGRATSNFNAFQLLVNLIISSNVFVQI